MDLFPPTPRHSSFAKRPVATHSEPLTLILEPDNPCNTNLYDEKDGRILYQVITHYRRGAVTEIRNIEGETIASWEWRGGPEVIKLGNAHPVPLSAWLKKSVIPFKDNVTFQDYSGRHLKWKGNGPGMSLELFLENDKKHPIAWFLKSHNMPYTQFNPYESSSRSTQQLHRVPARLLVDRTGQEIIDLVVISFLILENNRRSAESSMSGQGKVDSSHERSTSIRPMGV